MTAERFANSPTPLHLRFRTLNCEADGLTTFHELFTSSPNAIWLDSPGATLSILCDTSGPYSRSLFFHSDANPSRNNAFAAAQDLLDSYDVHIPADLPCEFALGLVGAFGYELKNHADAAVHGRFPLPQDCDVPRDVLPELALIYTDRAVVIDHTSGRTHLLYLMPLEDDSAAVMQESWVNKATEAIERGDGAETEEANDVGESDRRQERPVPEFALDQSKDEYLDSIQRCLDFIAAGDSYEVCLTNTAQGPSLADMGFSPESAYRSLRHTSPVPYGAFLKFSPNVASSTHDGSDGSSANGGDFRPFHILSASPEQFLKITNRRVTAQPIKGTRPRGRNAEEDAAWRQELRNNSKDRAENLMIVDLLRNDLGRVCEVGSVRVPRIFAVETYSHVHQLVSTIEGQLAYGVSPLDCVAACFPGGSMTGAPKVRTMEIIQELERRPRGFYSGAVGWISPNGCADLSIVIRTLVCSPNATTFGVGGAIVWDSDPEGEFKETMVKARALLEALGARVLE